MFARLLRCSGVEERVAYGSPIGFLALHGGLEPGTEGVAARCRGGVGASRYIVTQPRTLGWHVPSHRIVTEEVPGLAGFLDHVDIVISVHGYFRPEWPDAVYVGGGESAPGGLLAAQLRAAVPDLEVVDDLHAIPRRLRGVEPAEPGEREPGRRGPARAPALASARRQRRAPAAAARLTEALADFAVELAGVAA